MLASRVCHHWGLLGSPSRLLSVRQPGPHHTAVFVLGLCCCRCFLDWGTSLQSCSLLGEPRPSCWCFRGRAVCTLPRLFCPLTSGFWWLCWPCQLGVLSLSSAPSPAQHGHSIPAGTLVEECSITRWAREAVAHPVHGRGSGGALSAHRVAGLPAGAEHQDRVGPLSKRRPRPAVRHHRQEPRRRLLEENSRQCGMFHRQVPGASGLKAVVPLGFPGLLWTMSGGSQRSCPH